MTDLTITAARYGNPDHTAAEVETEEEGWILASPTYNAELWAWLHVDEPEIPVVAFVAPLADLPVLSDRQFFQGLAEREQITWEAAEAAVTVGALPAELEGYIDEIPDVAERRRAKLKAKGARDFRFDDPLVPLIAAKKGWDDPTLREFWSFCATL